MNIKDLLAKGLLTKTDPDERKAQKSIVASKRKLLLAEAELKSKLFEGCVISVYSSMFHAARALLFRDGFKEKSHYAVYVYLSEIYSGKIEEKYMTELNNLRTERHNLMYGLDEDLGTNEDEAKELLLLVKEFVKKVEEQLKK